MASRNLTSKYNECVENRKRRNGFQPFALEFDTYHDDTERLLHEAHHSQGPARPFELDAESIQKESQRIKSQSMSLIYHLLLFLFCFLLFFFFCKLML